MKLLGKGPLEIYLNDHLAGSSAGLSLARRLAREDGAMAEIADEIAEDRAALEDVMRRLDVPHDQVRLAAAWGGEQARRVLRVAWVLNPGGVGRFEELEVLLLGVTGKLALWRALEATRGGDPRLAAVDLARLAARAEAQRERIEALRLRAATEALAA